MEEKPERLEAGKKDLSEWYNQVVIKAELADHSAAKGFMFIKPYGYSIWENIQSILDKKFKDKGHKNAACPTLIPEKLFKKEKKHIKGFAPEVFLVTHSGNKKLNERLAVRPTSETIINDTYSKWIRSWRDLPLLINYWNSAFRAEITGTKLFLRTSEFLWQEGHTVHATEKDADKEVYSILDSYVELLEEHLAIPVLVGIKTELERFPGALYTTTLEALMPDGKALQCGTSHNLGQNFSKAFEIDFLDKDGKKKFAWTTSWGVSTRLIGALVMVHGDDKGLVIPPRIAPIEIVIVPIIFKKDKKNVMKEALNVFNKLKDFRVELDDREEYSSGWKFNEWELKGVPLRLEIGPRDVKKKQVILVRRDNGDKKSVKVSQLDKVVKKTLEEIQDNLFNKAKKFLNDNIKSANNFKEFEKLIKDRKIIKANWCGGYNCEIKIKDKTGASSRLIPFKGKASGKCVHCGKKAKEIVYFSKAY